MSLLIESGEDGASELLAALLTGKIIPGLSTLQELLEDEDASAELLVELQRLSTMPEDAAVRWGVRAAAHTCANPMKCLVGQARLNPEGLDFLHGRLVAAKSGAEDERLREARVPEWRTGLLTHREGEEAEAHASGLQANVAAARRATAEAAHAAETPAAAATAVRQQLTALGVCLRGQAAFLHGFVGSSNQFEYHQDTKGHARREGLDAVHSLENLTPAEEVSDKWCCERDCIPHMTAEDITRVRRKYSGAGSTQAKVGVLADFLWDDSDGRLRAICHARVRIIFGRVGDVIVNAACKSAEMRRGAEYTSKVHGLVAYREQHPPTNKTPPEVEARVIKHFESLTRVMPEVMQRNGKKIAYRRCSFAEYSSVPELARHYNAEWSTGYGIVTEKV